MQLAMIAISKAANFHHQVECYPVALFNGHRRQVRFVSRDPVRCIGKILMGSTKIATVNQGEFSQIERIADFAIGLEKIRLVFAYQTGGVLGIEANDKV